MLSISPDYLSLSREAERNGLAAILWLWAKMAPAMRVALLCRRSAVGRSRDLPFAGARGTGRVVCNFPPGSPLSWTKTAPVTTKDQVEYGPSN